MTYLEDPVFRAAAAAAAEIRQEFRAGPDPLGDQPGGRLGRQAAPTPQSPLPSWRDQDTGASAPSGFPAAGSGVLEFRAAGELARTPARAPLSPLPADSRQRPHWRQLFFQEAAPRRAARRSTGRRHCPGSGRAIPSAPRPARICGRSWRTNSTGNTRNSASNTMTIDPGAMRRPIGCTSAAASLRACPSKPTTSRWHQCDHQVPASVDRLARA